MYGSILSAAGSEFGGWMETWAGKEAGQAQLKATKRNAEVLRDRARMVEQQSARETELMVDESRRLQAEQKASFAASGATVGEGTSLLVMAEQAGKMQKDILVQRRNRAIEAMQMRNQAAMDVYMGKQAWRAQKLGMIGKRVGGALQSGGSLLGGSK